MIMDARTLYNLLEPHLSALQPKEKQTLSKMISGERSTNRIKRRQVLSLKAAKKKLTLFRHREMIRESR